MRIHTVIDIHRPDRIIDVRQLMLALDNPIEVGVPGTDELAPGYLRGFELLTDRMVCLTVDLHDSWGPYFPEEQIDDHEEMEDWGDEFVYYDLHHEEREED